MVYRAFYQLLQASVLPVRHVVPKVAEAEARKGCFFILYTFGEEGGNERKIDDWSAKMFYYNQRSSTKKRESHQASFHCLIF